MKELIFTPDQATQTLLGMFKERLIDHEYDTLSLLLNDAYNNGRIEGLAMLERCAATVNAARDVSDNYPEGNSASDDAPEPASFHLNNWDDLMVTGQGWYWATPKLPEDADPEIVVVVMDDSCISVYRADEKGGNSPANFRDYYGPIPEPTKPEAK